MTRGFDRFARASAHLLGTPQAFIAFVGLVLAWAIGWGVSGWRETWLVGFTLLLSVLTQATAQLIRYSEEASSAALHAKMDLLIVSNEKVSNALIGAEEKTPEEIRRLREG